jgi:toxin CcdB
MARYDLYANPLAAERKVTPYFLDLQNSHLDFLSTRVVVPLRREKVFGPRAKRLHPVVEFEGEALVLDTGAIGAVPAAELKRPLASLASARADIQEALDTLFGAY